MPKITTSVAIRPSSKLSVAGILQRAHAVAANAANNAAPVTNASASSSPASTVMSRRISSRASRSRPAGASDVDEATLAAEIGTAAPIGPAVIELISLAHKADVPALLIGLHGIGKSEIAAAAAAAMNIDFITRDLSLMEPTDLVGLPQIANGATKFLPPEFLPRTTGRGGLLLIEEINRSPRYMQASCLELLTSRRLNSYRLPPGWLPVACINPKAEGYAVDLLDAALMSRFMRIDVTVAVEPWVAWARSSGIHPKIIEYVESVPNALDESKGGSNPRSWAYASRTLLAAGPETLERSPDTIVTALNGIIGPVHTTAFLRLVLGTEVALRPSDVIGNWSASRATMVRWAKQGRLDLLTASMRAVLQWLRPDGVAEELRKNIRAQVAVRAFFRMLPGDLAQQSCACLHELGYTDLIPTTVQMPEAK